MHQLTGPIVQCSGQIGLLIGSRCPDLLLSPFGHPFVADLGQEVNIQLVGKEKRRILGQSLNEVANPSQPAEPFGVIVSPDRPGPFPGITQLVQDPADGLAGGRVTALNPQLSGQGGATPPRAAPAKSSRSLF